MSGGTTVPNPRDLGENNLQALNEARINPFAATLIAESYGMGTDVGFTLESVSFCIVIKNGRKVRVTLQDETRR
jgi:hypothetical protein